MVTFDVTATAIVDLDVGLVVSPPDLSVSVRRRMQWPLRLGRMAVELQTAVEDAVDGARQFEPDRVTRAVGAHGARHGEQQVEDG